MHFLSVRRQVLFKLPPLCSRHCVAWHRRVFHMNTSWWLTPVADYGHATHPHIIKSFTVAGHRVWNMLWASSLLADNVRLFLKKIFVWLRLNRLATSFVLRRRLIVLTKLFYRLVASASHLPLAVVTITCTY